MSKERLFQYIREEKVTIWAGAGFSKYAGYPLAGELRDKIFAKLDPAEQSLVDNRSPLDVLTEEFVRIKHGDKTMLYEILVESFCKAPSSTEQHDLLAGIPHIKDIITTNYDPLFETAYAGRSSVIIRDQDVPDFSSSHINIIKIHGDLKYPKTVVVTKGDYAKFYNLDKGSPLWSLIIKKISTDVLLFVGYGYEDPNIWAICDHVASYLESGRKDAYLIAPGLPPHKIEFLRQKGITYLDSTVEVFLRELYENIKQNILPDFHSNTGNPETLRKFLLQHNIKVELIGEGNGFSIKSLRGVTEQLTGDFTFKLNNDTVFLDRYKSIFEDGMVDPLELDESAATDIKVHVEGLNLYGDSEIAKIVIRKNPSKILDFDLTFPGTDLEINNLKAELYDGTKRFTLIVRIHNYTLNIAGSKTGAIKNNVNFSLHNNLLHPSTKEAIEAYKFCKSLFSAELFIVHFNNGKTFNYRLPNKVAKNIKIAEGYLRYLERLRKIETQFAIRFKDFVIQGQQDEPLVQMLFRIIEGKPVPVKGNSLDMIMSRIYANTLKTLVEMQTGNNDIDINFKQLNVFELYGYRFNLVKIAVKVVAAKAINLEEVKQRKTKVINIISKTGKIYEYYTLENASATKIEEIVVDEQNMPG